MSAYVVEDEVINRIVSYLSHARGLEWTRREISEKLGVDLTTHAGQEELARAMFTLNCNAVEQRYGDGEASSFRALDFQYKRDLHANNMQAYKSLGTWRYQCNEGDVPDTSVLFRVMTEVYADLAHKIVRGLKEYERING